MIKVTVTGDPMVSLKKFMKRCTKEGLLRELKTRERYIKPSMAEHQRIVRLTRAKRLGKI